MQDIDDIVAAHWQRSFRQQRGQHTQQIILDTAEELILEKGIEATAVTEVASRAGVSVGAVYHHFKDKRAIFLALFQRTVAFYESLYAEFEDPAFWSGTTVRDIFRSYLAVSIRTRKHIIIGRAAAAAMAEEYPALARRFGEIMIWGRTIALTHILERADEIGHDDPETAVRIMLDQLSAMFAAHIDPSRRAARLRPLEGDAFIECGLEITSAYLRLE